ncbi:MAG: zinc ribbon domain-containing protein [Dehalococcoidia bacterium]
MNYCPNCGNKIETNQHYCPSCGQTLIQAVNQEREQNNEIKRIKAKMKEARINEITLALFGGLLIGGGIIFILQRIFTVDIFDVKVVFIDNAAIGGVVAIILGIVCCAGASDYGNKYNELERKL